MARPLYKIIKFPASDTKNGVLCMFQPDANKKNAVPFEIKKVLAITGMKGKDSRGAHTHHKTNQILVALTGGCTVDLENGEIKKSVTIDKLSDGLLLYPYVWHSIRNFKPNTVLLVLADTKYDEREYIRDYNEFLSYVKKPAKKNIKTKK
jgi:dTDP-4-dehydrorhamnose 3,5-epimerase-like enzyme